jgi:integrase
MEPKTILMRRPKYVQAFVDRHGTARYYLRRPGFKPVPLPGLPWSPSFMAAYEEALSGEPKRDIGASRVKAGSMRALCMSWYQSPRFLGMKPRSQADYRNALDRLCEQTDSAGFKIGDKPATITQEVIELLIARRAAQPESAYMLRRTLREICKHAIAIKIRKDDPTRDIKAVRAKSDGYHSWTDDEIAIYEAHYAIGSTAMRAVTLFLETGQRAGDVVRMGRQHIRTGRMIYVKQQKTRKELLIPITDRLAAIIAATPADNLTFLTDDRGRPFTRNAFCYWFRDRCDEAGLPRHCSSHGLRKAAARRLAETGCSTHEIAAITGHKSLKELQRYTDAADQELAKRAMERKRTQRPQNCQP